MTLSEQDAVSRARTDLARRLGVTEVEVAQQSVAAADFPDASLGAPLDDEMSAQVITPGWRIRLSAKGRTYEYRANQNQLRLVNFDGENHVVRLGT
jgi:hypothetical protein